VSDEILHPVSEEQVLSTVANCGSGQSLDGFLVNTTSQSNLLVRTGKRGKDTSVVDSIKYST
jgi:hypothetical protein